MVDDPIQSETRQVDLSLDAYDRLRELAASYLRSNEIRQLDKAYELAKQAHKGQVRKTGEAFINHPVQVALILVELRMDADSITAAILHDTVEDSEVTLDIVQEQFGADVRELVDGVTKITQIEVESLSEHQANNLRKMLLAMSKDIRVIIIKLADRLHNMRTLQALREDRRIFKARETMEIYAPLAHRLGINAIKWELEDLAFYYLEPARFQQLSRMVKESRQAREEYLGRSIGILEGELEKLGIEARISGRPKHLYSIYLKMAQKGKDFSEIYDLIALRVIVETQKECYACLGAVHNIWRPMPGRFKDYIAMPKINNYRSLHTTVIGPAGRSLEIQIRTSEMHAQSEYGVAAHWRYKEGNKTRPSDAHIDELLSWIRQMIDWTDDSDDPREFMESLRQGLTSSEVYVFTPKGEVINLRSGSSPIDFAYAIHTEVGNHCVGAKVNGNIVSLGYELQTGDRVEVLTRDSASPSRDWLNIVKTPSARSKIRAFFSRITRDDDISHGRELLGHEMRKSGLGISSNRSVKALKAVAEEFGHRDPDDLIALIGAGKVKVKQVANRLLRELAKDSDDSAAAAAEKLLGLSGSTVTIIKPERATNRKKKQPGSAGVVVKGLDDVLVRLPHCCNPVPGDEIIGCVTRGRGVTVHRADCPNAESLKSTPERMISVWWADDPSVTYKVEIMVEAYDRLKLYQDVTSNLSGSGVNMLRASMEVHRDGIVEMSFLFEVGDTSSIERILADLRSVDGVIDARRMLPGEASNKRKGAGNAS
ncbi:MAG: bifunctional (p)ppGpp synthetase/guanosine-3',5'-bis(diphosphate) 3'-pyrophosphohydrolase [Coriobacteriales bacterium]|jgi:GTP pyrophosphokinase|nr:bifunctional (p)ppGpp synthetase/guanosine-3',5'-bis(diphosphate) 3'-pyrophosphohydrolase [Coriobacteriales bacterium]